MNTALIIVAGIVALAVLYLLLAPMARVDARFRGKRVISCPENQQFAAVEVDAAAAALSGFGEHKLRLRECTRWPERQACGQECLSQIEAAPEDCLVRKMLARWDAGKHAIPSRHACHAITFCDRQIGGCRYGGCIQSSDEGAVWCLGKTWLVYIPGGVVEGTVYVAVIVA